MKRKTDWLAVAKALEDFSAAIPERDEATVADDYPEAWRELQKRRRLVNWGFMLMALGLLSAGLIRACDFWISPNLAAIRDGHALQVLVLATMAPGFVLSCGASLFKCPRCHSVFFQINARGDDHTMKNPDSRCRNCRLRIGEPR